MKFKLPQKTSVAAGTFCVLALMSSIEGSASTLNHSADKPASSNVPFNADFTHFEPQRITGFLNPQGFDRPGWQRVASGPLLRQEAPATGQFVVVLDPGHGGVDPGAEAHNGLLEKDLTLDIARRARLYLSEFDDISVVLTREHDHGLSRQSRVDAIRRSQADVVISLHLNHLPQREITLVETYFAGPENIRDSLQTQRKKAASRLELLRHTANSKEPDLSFTQGSARLAKILQQKVFNEVRFHNDDADDAGVKRETLFVLTRTATPSVLIELTCLSNHGEADKLATAEYRSRLAAALVDGIRSYRESLINRPLDSPGQLGT